MDDFNPPDLASPEGEAQNRGWLAGIRLAVSVAQGCNTVAEVIDRLKNIPGASHQFEAAPTSANSV